MKRLYPTLLACGIAVASHLEAADFSLALLPDTQNSASGFPQVFAAQTAWIASNAASLNISAVGHLGDVVNSDTATEWQTARTAMHSLDTLVPYVMTTGNHDYTGGYSGGSLLYNPAYFGPGSPYARQPEISFRDTNRTDAAYLTFQAGGGLWLMLAIPWQAPVAVLDWANTIIQTHPDHTVLIVTHDYLIDTGDARSSPGNALWNSLVRKHRNILMVFCGHAITTRGGVLESRGDNGNIVYQMLSNYQQLPNGGNGWLRLVEISRAGTVAVSTYSPFLDQWDRTPEHQFSFSFINDYTDRTTISRLSLPDAATLELRWESKTNRLYSILAAPSLSATSWPSIAANLPATPPLNTRTLPLGRKKLEFYRISSTYVAP